MAEYISRAEIIGKLTGSDTQQKIKAMSGADAYNEFLTLLNAEPKADIVPVAMLEKWLYENAFNNCGNHYGDYCEEIIRRLPGLRVFVAESGG